MAFLVLVALSVPLVLTLALFVVRVDHQTIMIIIITQEMLLLNVVWQNVVGTTIPDVSAPTSWLNLKVINHSSAWLIIVLIVRGVGMVLPWCNVSVVQVLIMPSASLQVVFSQ